MSFAEWDACLGCKLDLWKWDNNEYPIKFKTRVMAFWKLHNLVELHTQDEVNRQVKKKSKK